MGKQKDNKTKLETIRNADRGRKEGEEVTEDVIMVKECVGMKMAE